MNRYKSEKKTYVSGSNLEFFGWIPRFGPGGGRNVVDRFQLVCEATDVSQASAVVEGEDVYRFFSRVRVEQAGGVVRWNLQGDELRAMLYMLEGAGRVHEHADIAVANNQSLVFKAILPMRKRFAKRPNDFSLPADLLAKLTIECPTAASISANTTIAAARYYVVAYCHEEHEVELKCEDVIAATPFPSTAGCTFKAGGRVKELAIYKRAVAGGDPLTGCTGIRVEELMPVELAPDPDLVRPYLADRGAAENSTGTDGDPVHNDPATSDRLYPILWSTEDTSSFDGPEMDDVVIYTTSTEADQIALHRTVRPLSRAVAAGVQAAYRLPETAFKVKTEAKTKRKREDWIGSGRGSQLGYMPKKAPLIRQGR